MDTYRIESREDVSAFLQNLRYAFDNNSKIEIMFDRKVDQLRPVEQTNRYTINALFPNDDPCVALRSELYKLRTQEYMRTVKDIKYPNKKEFREFGRIYDEDRHVYIKIRVILNSATDYSHLVFIMSFHFAEHHFSEEDFPYKQ